MPTPLPDLTVSQIREEGLDLSLSLNHSWFARWLKEDPKLEFAGPGEISVSLHVERHGRDILVRGELKGKVHLSCSRCLVPFDQPVASGFLLLLSPVPPFQEAEEELSAADLDRDFYDGEVVHLEDILREQVLLNLPLKPLCSESCRGICPRCGADLNIEACRCPAAKTDSPAAK